MDAIYGLLSILPFGLMALGNVQTATPNHKELMRLFVDQVVNKHDTNAADGLFQPNYVEHNKAIASMGGGVEGFKKFASMVFAAFPDVKVTIVDLIAEGDKVSYYAEVSGTHRGNFMGIPATNKKVTWTETHLFRFSNRKIAEHYGDADLLALMQQLGAIPPPPGK